MRSTQERPSGTDAPRATRSRRTRFAVILLTAIALLWVATPLAKAHLQAVAVLREVSGQPVPWMAHDMTVPVTKQDIHFPITVSGSQQLVRARLYLPQGMPNAPAMVVFHGVHHLGIDEPRMVGFATAMASCGIRVLTPELPGIKDYHVSADSVQTIAGSVHWYAQHTGGPVGVMGLSFAGGLALVAATDPAVRSDFKFVFAVGSQDSMGRVSEYYLTGRDPRPDGTTEVLKPHEYGALVLEYKHVEDFVPAADVEPVRSVLRAHLYEDKQAEAAATLALNDTQRSEAKELMATTSPATRARIAAMVAKHTDELPGLSPIGRLAEIETPVYLLHGQADNIIPAAETLWMERELPPDELQAALVSPVLSHIDLDGTPGAMDEWHLVYFFAQVMRAAERR